MKNFVSTPAYTCIRWGDGEDVTSYLLIAIDTITDNRANLHFHLEAGYFAFWSHGEWKVRCQPYAGFDLKEALYEEHLRSLLPPGAVLPTWRIKPPRITVKRLMQGVEIRWDNHGWFDSKRTITWEGGVVRCVDRWSGFRKRVVGEWKV